MTKNELNEGLISHSLTYFIQQELNNHNVQLNPVDKSDSFSELLEPLGKCLWVYFTLKITELTKHFGSRYFYDENFMLDSVTTSKSEKWSYFDQALYSISMKDVLKDTIQKNLHLDFNYVFGQDFFYASDVEGLLKSIEKMYIGEEQSTYNDFIISCE